MRPVSIFALLYTVAIALVVGEKSYEAEISYYPSIVDDAIWVVPTEGVPLETPIEIYVRFLSGFAHLNEMSGSRLLQNVGLFMKRPWFMWDRAYQLVANGEMVKPGQYAISGIDTETWRDEYNNRTDYSALKYIFFPGEALAEEPIVDDEQGYASGGAQPSPVDPGKLIKDDPFADHFNFEGKEAKSTADTSNTAYNNAPAAAVGKKSKSLKQSKPPSKEKSYVFRIRLNIPNTMSMFLRKHLRFMIKARSVWYRGFIRWPITVSPRIRFRSPNPLHEPINFLRSTGQRFNRCAKDIEDKINTLTDCQNIIRGRGRQEDIDGETSRRRVEPNYHQ
jgi:hypothetical protein